MTCTGCHYLTLAFGMPWCRLTDRSGRALVRCGEYKGNGVNMAEPIDWMSERERKAFRMLLDIWADHMRRNDHALDFRGRCAIERSDGALDSQQLYDRADFDLYRAVDACLENLEAHQRAAISRCWSIHAVWRFPRLVFEESVLSAERAMVGQLKRNSLTAIHFFA